MKINRIVINNNLINFNLKGKQFNPNINFVN